MTFFRALLNASVYSNGDIRRLKRLAFTSHFRSMANIPLCKVSIVRSYLIDADLQVGQSAKVEKILFSAPNALTVNLRRPLLSINTISAR